MSCEICKRERNRTDVLCQPCREAVARLARICRTNPEVLSKSEAAKQAVAESGWGAEAAVANS